ncbi:MAG TPA: lysine 5,6-aminomutase subunit alpha, partial [Haloplasmataceae bacterium]
MTKLNLDFDIVKKARMHAKNIAIDVQKFIDIHTTVTVERAVCRLLGIDGVNKENVPLPNVLVDHIKDNGDIAKGVCFYIGNAMLETGLTPQEIAVKTA